MAQLTINYTANSDLSAFSTWLTNNVASSTYDSTTKKGTLTLNEGVTTIGDNAFLQCQDLLTISIPEGITSINYRAFYGSANITYVELPSTLTTLQDQAFWNNNNLPIVKCNAVTPPSIGNNNFSYQNDVLYIPIGSLSAYKNSTWNSKFQNILEWNGNAVITYHSSVDLSTYSTWITNNAISTTYDSTTQIGTIEVLPYEIGQQAFYRCNTLTEVEFTNIISLNSSAFQLCPNLTSITFSNSLTNIGTYAFYGCTGLISITLPNSLTVIGQEAFRECTSLTSVTFGNNITEIKSSAFNSCTNLNTFTIPSSVTSLDRTSFNNTGWWNNQADDILYKDDWCLGYKTTKPTGDLSINADKIANNAFQSCTGLTSITLPNSLTVIGSQAFYGCTGLTSITLPNSLTTIGGSAFSGCTSLATIYWNAENVTTYLGYSSTFGSCPVSTVVFGDSVQSIPNHAFTNCSSLTSVTFGNSITSIGQAFISCTSLTTIYWNAENVTTYSGYNNIFGSNTHVSTVIFGDSVQSIPNYAFSSCSSLTSVTFGNSITSIPNNAFKNCTGLTSITIPVSVTSIGQEAFNGCTNLLSVTCKATTPPTLGTTNFTASNDTLYVPSASVSAYQNDASWSAAFTNIEAIPTVINYTATSDLMTSPTSWMTSNVASSTYDSTTQEGTLTLNSGVTTITDYAFSQKTTLTSIVFPDGLTSLGGWLFYNCTNLLSISIPASVSVIGSAISMGCTKLASIIIDSNNTYYDSRDNCNAVIETSNNTLTAGCKNTIIPSSVTNIGAQAFYGCTGLTGTISLINCTSIGQSAFQGCSNITTVLLSTGISINSSVFYNCTRLSSIDLSTVTSIGNSAFYGCTGLTGTISLINCTSIGENAFQNCPGISSVNLSNNLTTIGKNAFTCSGSSRLQSIYIPASVTSIGSASYGARIVNPTVSSIIVDSNNTHYDSRDNCNCIIETATDKIIQGCVNSTIPNTVKIIGFQALAACQFTNLVIPEGVTTIESYGLQSNTYLTTLKLPSTLTLMSGYATEYCSSLRNVYCYATTPPTLYGTNFTASNDTLYMPAASKSAYQSASNWSTAFTNYVGICEVTSTVTGSGSVSPSSTTLNEGESVTITITPDEGYGIFSVTDNGTSVPVTRTGMTYTISNIAADHVIAVVFKPLFTITTSAGEGGSITPSMTIMQNEDATVVITPNAGYSVSHVYVDGVDQGSILNYSFQNVVANHTVAAEFVALYTVSTTTTEGGTITPASSTVVAGSDVTLTITPNEGMLIFNVLDNDTPVPVLNPLGMTYTISNIQENHTVEAIFMVAQNYGFDLSEMIDTDFMIQTLEELEERK